MYEKNIIEMRVCNLKSHEKGIIKAVHNGLVEIDFHGDKRVYSYPSAFAGTLEIEDEKIQAELLNEGQKNAFEEFKQKYKRALVNEINFLKETGGKKYRIIDGERISNENGEYIYSFETDSDLHFQDGTAIKLLFPQNKVLAYVLSCEDFNMLIKSREDLGEKVGSVEFTSDQWQLLEELIERMDEMNPDEDTLAYKVACLGKTQITEWEKIRKGQDYAFKKATSAKNEKSKEITFIWGPPGTGKTESLAKIAIEHISKGRRVLMLSYSNVSVDGALLRVAKKIDLSPGTIIRYGYPQTEELLKSNTLTSYQCVISKNPRLKDKFRDLLEKKRKLKRNDPERIKANDEIKNIRKRILDEEKALIKESMFVATTVSKAIADSAVFTQRFDVVIFDEASMAYVPQIVFSAGLSKQFFICMGDFCQLPAIVQNNYDNNLLSKNIFEHTGIVSAVNNQCGHEWLVMLDTQYRMHRDIAEFVSEQMYYGILKTSETVNNRVEKISEFSLCSNAAMSIFDLSDTYSVCLKTKDGSRVNVLSALVCLRLAEKILDKYDVGIITPYSAQSRLILSMIRAIRENDERWKNVSCATVHQFQGSEKDVIIYDVVDCFRMRYPGALLTLLKNETANRLFNVALTRTKEKFILVANINYLVNKGISPKLMFTQAIRKMSEAENKTEGISLMDELMPCDNKIPLVYFENREKSWLKFISDLEQAQSVIHMEIPDVIIDDDRKINKLIEVLNRKKASKVEISLRTSTDTDVPIGLQKFQHEDKYVTTPVTLIDRNILWFGQPLYDADFISRGKIIATKQFPCARFCGGHTVKLLEAFLEI